MNIDVLLQRFLLIMGLCMSTGILSQLSVQEIRHIQSKTNTRTLLRRLRTVNSRLDGILDLTEAQNDIYDRLWRKMRARNATDDRRFARVYTERGKLPTYKCSSPEDWACLPKRKMVLCINASQVCDGFPQCPNGDDEDPLQCSFHKQTIQLISTQSKRIEELTKILESTAESFDCKSRNLENSILHHTHHEGKGIIPPQENCDQH